MAVIETSDRAGAGPSGRADPEPAPEYRLRTRASVWTRMKRERWTYAFIVPGVLFFAVFAYIPLLGNVVAFQDFSPYWGIFNSEWVGFDNFVAMMSDPQFMRALRNTLTISFLQIAFAFPAPILLAILLNSLISDRIKRMVQSIVYLPHFISWVIVISIWQQVLGGAGPVADLFSQIGVDGVNIMSNPDTFKILVTSQVIWKDIGWGTIIFFAAISGIPSELYEAAAADGAGPMRRIWHVTLPGMVPVITLLLILTIGSVLTVGFEQLLLQQPAVGSAAAEVLDTFVYYRGIQGGDWGLATAAGLFKGVIGTILVVAANKFAKRLGTGGLF
ncbi:binding-protein-dependent transport systems inner membrane component [Beutenbergia cavernae DSM 12333]|uniref:Binding-protein-dependent transport systems inner membrane component n=1 Tax=Beutenbergia cavernae (strain ATCC BAA-8 / DSM 12333 / CCUG 43141 / JCM 11478 / NBRC 16432 / NCIMB 13614 / HKI 0122) TaxID=471853 RepID=C5C5E2_BEUC1|nr:ABC transporter permease subunit [Beutenbergia cavernae]ACQ82282.1 binding-protein-dependent transport systems inner membrane component [Beutenbergia cavernae DSM 12333]